MDSPSTPSASQSYRKPDKKHYDKWMSNADISETLQSMETSADTVAVTKRFIEEGVIEADAAFEFEQFIMRFQLPKEDVPGFCEEELMKLADTLEPPQADVPQDGGAVAFRSRETEGESSQIGGSGMDSMIHANGNATVAEGASTNDPAVGAEREGENNHPSSEIENATVKRETQTPPKDVTPPPEMNCLSDKASQPKQGQMQRAPDTSSRMENPTSAPAIPSSSVVAHATSSGPSSVVMQNPSNPSSAVHHRLQPSESSRPILSRPRFRIVGASPYFNPRQGQGRAVVRTLVAVSGSSIRNATPSSGIIQNQQRTVPTTVVSRTLLTSPSSSSSSQIARNLSVTKISSTGVRTTTTVAVDIPNYIHREVRQQPERTAPAPIPTATFMTGGVVAIPTGRIMQTPASRLMPTPMTCTYTSQALANSMRSVGLPQTNVRQPHAMGSYQVQLPAPRCQTLQLSPYISGFQAEQRVRDIGIEAAQREIYNFAALIDARRQAEFGHPFPFRTNSPRVVQHHPQVCTIIRPPVQLRIAVPNLQFAARGQGGHRIELLLRAPPPTYNGMVPGHGNTSNFSNFNP